MYTILVEKPEEKRPHGRPRCIWEDGIKMELWDIGWGCRVDAAGSRYGQVVGCCEDGDKPSGSAAT
jgi:hypothetical protein